MPKRHSDCTQFEKMPGAKRDFTTDKCSKDEHAEEDKIIPTEDAGFLLNAVRDDLKDIRQ